MVEQRTPAAFCSQRAAAALGLLGAMGAGEGAAALGELALPAIPAIMRDVHARRRARSQSEAGPGLDDGDQRSAGAPSLAVVELLGAFPTLLGQLVRTMEQACAAAATTVRSKCFFAELARICRVAQRGRGLAQDQDAVDHLCSLRLFLDAGILRSAGALAEDCERGARGAARAASQRGGRVAQEAAELAALLPDGYQ